VRVNSGPLQRAADRANEVAGIVWRAISAAVKAIESRDPRDAQQMYRYLQQLPAVEAD